MWNTIFDPNIVVYLCVFHLPVQGNNSKFLCCLCCKTGPISALFLVDRSGYVPGDSIILNFDPNIVVYLCMFQLPVQGNNSKFLCCLCCKTGPISALFRVDRSGYVPGDSIILNAEISNNSNRTMNSSKVRLIQVCRPLVKSVYQKINFLISQPKHMLRVLKRTVSMRQFF